MSVRNSFLVLSILLSAGAAAFLMHASQDDPIRTEVARPPVAVSVIEARPAPATVLVESSGSVTPIMTTELGSEVFGIVTEVEPRLVAGGRFAAGETMLKIEDVAYRTALEEARGALAEAESEFAQEKARAEIAFREEKGSSVERSQTARELARREPQLAAAEARVTAAAARFGQASHDLARTTVRAPFDALVLKRHVGIGRYVQVGATLATLVPGSVVEVRLPLSRDQLAVFDLNRIGSAEPPLVQLSAEGGDRWEGRIVRTEGVFDEESRLIFAVVRVEESTSEAARLRIGSFVQARIAAGRIDQAIVLPRDALRGGARVLVVDESGTLRLREVEYVSQPPDLILVTAGLNTGSAVCTTRLSAVREGAVVAIESRRVSTELGEPNAERPQFHSLAGSPLLAVAPHAPLAQLRREGGQSENER